MPKQLLLHAYTDCEKVGGQRGQVGWENPCSPGQDETSPGGSARFEAAISYPTSRSSWSHQPEQMAAVGFSYDDTFGFGHQPRQQDGFSNVTPNVTSLQENPASHSGVNTSSTQGAVGFGLAQFGSNKPNGNTSSASNADNCAKVSVIVKNNFFFDY